MIELSDILIKPTDDVISVPSGTVVREAAKILTDNEIGVVIVTDPDDGVCGILSERDVASGVAEFGAAVADTPGPGLTLPPERLTPRQLEVLRLLAHGHNNAAIAEDLVIAEKSVENVVNAIFHRLAIPQTGSLHPRVMAALTYLETSRGE